jgi:hypothetical protein
VRAKTFLLFSLWAELWWWGFLFDGDYPTAKYFLQVVLSMLSLAFVSIMVQLRRRRITGPKHARFIVSGLLPIGLPLEEAFRATIATVALPSNSIVT